MARKSLRLCLHAGCGVLTREGYCERHRPKEQPRRESASWHPWYGLPIWKDDLRPWQLLHEPFCRECARKYPPGNPRHRTRATDVDHIVPHRGDWVRFTDRDNLQSLCHRCHSIKTMQERSERLSKK
jgi:5-methylcytosine-specific restriction protein A